MKSDNLPFPVSSIEFEKVYMVRDKRMALGYSDRELSFLLGYRALYVRDVEDPLHTLRYTPKDTNYLLSIFDCSLSELMPSKVALPFYQIKVVVSVDKEGREVYEIFQEIDKKFVCYKVLEPDPEKVILECALDDQTVKDYISHLFNRGYFNEPKTALEIYKKCVRRFGMPLRPWFVMHGLSFFTSKRKAPKLVQFKNSSARTVYKIVV